MNDERQNHRRSNALRTHEKDYQDYEYVLGEVRRVSQFSPAQMLKEFEQHPLDAFGGLKLLDGRYLFLPSEAQERFVQIARRGIVALGEAGSRHTINGLAIELKSVFFSLVLNSFELDTETVQIVFDRAIRNLEATYSELTYYVPCSVVAEKVRDEFAIGPVTFILYEKFVKENGLCAGMCGGVRNPGYRVG